MRFLDKTLCTSAAWIMVCAALSGCLNGTTPQPPPRVPKPKIDAEVPSPAQSQAQQKISLKAQRHEAEATQSVALASHRRARIDRPEIDTRR